MSKGNLISFPENSGKEHQNQKGQNQENPPLTAQASRPTKYRHQGTSASTPPRFKELGEFDDEHGHVIDL